MDSNSQLWNNSEEEAGSLKTLSSRLSQRRSPHPTTNGNGGRTAHQPQTKVLQENYYRQQLKVYPNFRATGHSKKTWHPGSPHQYSWTRGMELNRWQDHGQELNDLTSLQISGHLLDQIEDSPEDWHLALIRGHTRIHKLFPFYSADLATLETQVITTVHSSLKRTWVEELISLSHLTWLLIFRHIRRYNTKFGFLHKAFPNNCTITNMPAQEQTLPF